MKALIIEDEISAVQNLKYLLASLEPDLKIIQVIDTVSMAIDFLKKEATCDLIFMDIHLADGNAFEILSEIKPSAPIIFTTAYDQYAIKAFKVNSIDYLLKPLQESELKNALLKFKNSKQASDPNTQHLKVLMDLFQNQSKSYRQSFLVQKGETLIPVSSNDFAFFYIQNGVVRGVTTENNSYFLDGKLEDLENDLNPNNFFRANRQYLVQKSAIKSLSIYLNGRLIINTIPKSSEKIIVSKANAPKIKAWLNQVNGK